MAVNTWDGAVSTDYNDAGNWNTTGETDRVPTSADDVVIPDTSSINNCALSATGGNPKNVNSIKIEANGTVVGNDIEFRVYGENSSGFAVDIDGIISGDLNIQIKTPTTTSIDMTASSGKVKNLTINDADSIVNAETTVDITGNLNVTLGTFKTNGNVLTVAGSISGNGTLTASTSTVTVTGQSTVATVNITTGTYNYFDDFRPTTCNITDNATFNQTSVGGQFGGRVIITASKTPTFNAVGRLHSSLDIQSGEQGNSTFNLALSEDQTAPSRSVYFYNLTLDSQGTENNTLTLADSMFVTNNLTITDGEISCNGRNLTVTGVTSIGPGSGGSDQATLTCSSGTMSFGSGITSSFGVIVNQGGTFTGGTGAHTMGSFEVKNNSNAKMTMTSGECTIDSEKSSDNRAILVETNATFDNNDGTIKITHAGDTNIEFKSGTTSPKCPHHFTIDKTDNDVVTHGNLQIDGNLFIKIVDITHSMRPSSASDTLTVLGNVTINKGKLGDTTNYTGTLDFRDQVNINTDGVLIASSGTTKIAGTMDFDGTFTHNGGTVKLENTSEKTHSVANGTTFNHLQKTTAETMTFATNSQLTIISTLTINPSCNFKTRNGNQFTFGDASTACTVTNNGTFTNRNNNNTVTFQAGSQLKPFVFTGNDFDWDGDASSGNVQNYVISNCDWDPDITTGEYVSIQLGGDCEFDAFTLSANDTLDLNGQRAVFSGNLTIDSGGAMKSTGGGLIVANADVRINGSAEGLHDGDVNMIVEGGTHDWRNGAADGAAPWCRHVLVNGNITHADQLGGSSGNHNYNPESVIVGNGKLTQSGGHAYLKDLTIATGGDFEMTQSTQKDIDLSGDFTKSGGLISKSALNLTGAEEVTGSDNLDEVATSNRVTVEAWFKATTDANYRAIFSRGTSWATGNIYMYMNSDGNIQFSMNDLGATVTSTTSGLADGKWHHAAATYDQTNLKLYIDGKLEASSAYTNPINTQTNGFKIGDRNGDNWIGQMGRVSIWDAALTEAQIREMLFYNFATADASGTIPDANCIGWWQFDEGTGTAVADSSTNNADGTLNSAAWAGAGTFTQSTSTLIFAKSGAQNLNYYVSDNFNNITVNAGSTTTLNGFGLGSGAVLDCFGNLVVNGTLASTANNEIMKLRTADKTHNFSGTLTGLYSMIVDISSGDLNIPALTTPRLRMATSVTGTATGDLTITEELQVDSNTTFIANGKTITAKLVDLNDGTFNLGAGNLILSHTGGSNGFDTNAASVLAAGPGATISGSSAGTIFKSRNNFVVVGKVENLDVTTEELSVTGQVINCTGDIIQQHPTIDHDQQLDFDTADDRDIILGRDLDKNTELINS